MSYIDTFDHELIGYFGGIPVYHPLESVEATNENPRDFACNPTQLLIGGGHGEHPGIVIVSPTEAAMHFLVAFLKEPTTNLDEATRMGWNQIVEPWANNPARLFECPWIKVFDFAGWKTEDYVSFHERCTSPAFMRPFRPDQDGPLESWLASSVGEFLVLAMPELIEPLVLKLGKLRETIDSALYHNILLPPPGYPNGGRKEVNGSVNWRIETWQIQRKVNPVTVR
jgi:hypothetical protein